MSMTVTEFISILQARFYERLNEPTTLGQTLPDDVKREVRIYFLKSLTDALVTKMQVEDQRH